MIMTELRKKFHGQDWLSYAQAYFLSRFPSVEARLQTSFRFVDLHTENSKAFSYEFASILRDAGSIFGSIADVLAKGCNGVPSHERYDFGDYRIFLLKHIPDIYKKTVQMRSCFPKGIVVPFDALEMPNGTPEWWHAHNKIKHQDYEEYRLGNLENCVEAVSALAVLGHLMGVFVSDPLFVNVGIAYPKESIDMSIERRLFPDGGDSGVKLCRDVEIDC
jgi:hypothetical protein